MIDIARLKSLAARLQGWIEELESARTYTHQRIKEGAHRERNERIVRNLTMEIIDGKAELSNLLLAIVAAEDANEREEHENEKADDFPEDRT